MHNIIHLLYIMSLFCRVSFPESVKWLCIEFDPQCGTAQAEDSLQLYIPSLPTISPVSKRTTDDSDCDSFPVPYWPILQKFSGRSRNWPPTAIVLPGECLGSMSGIATSFIVTL
jgi:E3 ubiquitin-protein ligase MYCBP2